MEKEGERRSIIPKNASSYAKIQKMADLIKSRSKKLNS